MCEHFLFHLCTVETQVELMTALPLYPCAHLSIKIVVDNSDLWFTFVWTPLAQLCVVVSNCSPTLHKGGSPCNLRSKHYWLRWNAWSQRACLTGCRGQLWFLWSPQIVDSADSGIVSLSSLGPDRCCHCSILFFSFICFPQYSLCSLVQ